MGEKGKQNTGEIERLELEEMKNRNGGGEGLRIGVREDEFRGGRIGKDGDEKKKKDKGKLKSKERLRTKETGG